MLRRNAVVLAASLVLAIPFCALPASADAPPSKGPAVELDPEDKAPPPPPPPLVALGTGPTVDIDLARSLAEPRFQNAAQSVTRTAIGGYGELSVTGTTSGGSAREWTADARRVVLFVAHSFTQSIRVYTELEVEHAKEAEIEQGYIDWMVLGDHLGLRAGLVLVPMGITNEVHEPPTFNGVARPSVETVVIPTTWREVGAGFFGRPVEPLRYELYAVAGLDPLGFSATGFGAASGAGVVSKAKAWAAAGRLEWEPLLGVIVGASGYASNAGQNGDFHLKNKAVEDLTLPVVGFSIDARVRRAGIEAKVLYTEWRFPNTGALMRAYDAYGNALFPDSKNPVPTAIRGMYAELGYDVFSLTPITHQLVPFVRVEAYDTQASVPQGFVPNIGEDIREVTIGASYRPIREVVAKVDYQVRHHATGAEDTLFDVGIGFMY